ncbi:hypothetical protein J3B02_003068, partial [Coemansia erecta]
MITLRSRMWQHIARINSGMDSKFYLWDNYANNNSGNTSSSNGNGNGNGNSNGNGNTSGRGGGGGCGRGAEECGEWWGPHVGSKGYDYGMDTRQSLVR